MPTATKNENIETADTLPNNNIHNSKYTILQRVKKTTPQPPSWHNFSYIILLFNTLGGFARTNYTIRVTLLFRGRRRDEDCSG